MNKIATYIFKHFIPLFFAAVPAATMVGFIPVSRVVYYGAMILYCVYAFFQLRRINFRFLFLYLAMFVSCCASQSPDFFKMWDRFITFTLLYIAMTPVFSSPKMEWVRKNALQYIIYVCTALGVSSFFAYLLGINYMINIWTMSYEITALAGSFGGFTSHSMILGVSSAIGIIYLLYIIYNGHTTRKQKALLCVGIFCCFCCVMLSASRASLLAAMGGLFGVIYFKFKGHLVQLIPVLIGAVLLLFVTAPLYSSYTVGMIEKQEGNMKQGSTYSSREGSWNNRLEEFRSSPVLGIGPNTVSEKFTENYLKETGNVETGSSWLSVLSMTGLLGAGCLLLILIPTMVGLYKRSLEDSKKYSLLLALLIAFCIHMMAEGYIFAGGNILAVTFWLLLGVGYSAIEKNKKVF